MQATVRDGSCVEVTLNPLMRSLFLLAGGQVKAIICTLALAEFTLKLKDENQMTAVRRTGTAELK